MKATLAKAEGFERTLEITVEKDKVRRSYERLLGKFSRDVAVPGFRKGKAPRHMAEKALRPEYMQQHVLEDVGLTAYHEAVKEHSFEPISQPRVEWIQFDKEKEMIFKATFDVRPEIEVPAYAGLTVPMSQTEVQDEDVDAVLEAEQQKRTTLGTVEEERPLQLDDIATVNFDSWEDGEAVEGGKAENLLVELNDEFVMAGFSRHLVGMAKDQSRKFTDVFPADYKNPVLAGKTIEFEFKLLEIKQRIVPQLDDDFARQVSRYTSLQEMRDEVRKQLEVELHSAVGNKAIEQLLPSLHVHLPNSMLVQTGQNILSEWNKQLQSVGSDLNTFVRNQRWTQERLTSELLPRAHRVAVAELVVEAIARQESMSVSDEELQSEIDRFAKMSNQDSQVVRQSLENDKSIDQLRTNILRRKVLQHIAESVTVVKEEPAPSVTVDPSLMSASAGELPVESPVPESEAPAADAAPATEPQDA